MEIKPLSVYLAVCAALLAVCHGYSTGKEFITTFLPNYQGSNLKGHKLQLVLTAKCTEANVHIQVASVNYNKQLRLGAGESRWVSLPCGAELQKEFVTAKSTVRISSSAAISVVSFNRRFFTGDGTVVSPLGELGTEYFVYTPKPYMSMDSLFAIVNGNNENKISILPHNDVTLRGGNKWHHGRRVNIILAPYATYLVRGRSTLTGTRIQSQQPVAVLVGHQCMSMGYTCEHVYEQLPDLANLGTEYLVPTTISSKAKTSAVIVAVEDNTELTLHTQKQSLRRAGDVTINIISFRQPLVVKSTKKVMVLLLSDNRPHDPFMIMLIPTWKHATNWAVDTVDGLQSTIAIMSEREGAGSVRVCMKKGYCHSPKWSNIMSDTKWVWSNIPVGKTQSHVTVSGDARMAVYAYGGDKRHGYGIAGVCSGDTPPPPPPSDPCDQVKCRVKERCEKGKCVHVSLATCHAQGDPHYLTFDGRRYDFQGTCTYTMSTVAKPSPDLQSFTVMTTNNHRGNTRVAYVRTVTVTVHGHTIIISSQKGQVKVNGELQYLPVYLSGGKVSVKQSGSYAVLTTDFSLTVKYDWNVRLYITVPSSYYQHLGGLCGNYNGDRSDDLPEPNGRSLSAVLKMIQKWKSDESNRFCNDNCAGHCYICTKEQQAHYSKPHLCGILSKSDGPFSACYDKVEPSKYLENCVYDVCTTKGAKQTLCENLKSYADDCLSEEAKVDPEWRMVTKCLPNCPKGSHYEACGTPCPATCVSPDIDNLCKGSCVEGCQCDKGMVLSGDRCVPVHSCGCKNGGKYYPAAITFWGDNTCTSKCKCQKGKAECKPVTCKKSEHCALKGGVRDCYPTSHATCQGSGDPHYRNFDGRRFDFQGTCTYTLSQLTKGSEQDLEPFHVLVQNENRGRNKAVAYTKSVSLIVFGYTVSMSRASVGAMLVNSRSVNLPFSTEDKKLSLFRRGYFGYVRTSFGLTLRFNWKSYVSLTLPSTYSSVTGGLCGNYNGKPADDLMKPDGTQANDVNAFGDSWKAGGDFGCTSDCPGGKCPECEPAMTLRYQKPSYCGIIADKQGPFGQCHSKLDHSSFLNDCIFDMCAYGGHASALCNSLSAFSTSCQDAGAEVGSWRTEQFCPPSCGANSHYEMCAPPCQLTCSGPTSLLDCEDNALCTEGCVCDDGFMLSDDKCVPLAECGCEFDGQYYRNGQVFFSGESCDSRCVCSDGGNLECDTEFLCPPNEVCVVKEGEASCSPESTGSCSVSGIRTIRSFDGQDYPLRGDCLFTLAEVQEQEGGMEAFSVFVQQQTSKDGEVSRSVQLKVYNVEITMETGVVWEIKVDNVKVYLPVSLADGKVRVHQNGINIIITTEFDLKLTYDSVAGVFLQIPSTYSDTTRGLCGDYNGSPEDDLTSTAGKDSTDTSAAWVVTEDDVPCDTGCGATSCPKTDKQKDPDAEKACDIIKAQEGPFAGCHSTVKPTPDYKACVREMSTDKAGADILCRHIHNYVTACQLAGSKISKWRSDTFCPLKCPAGSHYELCTSSCSSTCSSLEESGPCPVCQEGCECDDDLISDGVRCVSVDKCGCVVDGQYYGTDTSVLSYDCSERCTCQSGQFSCSSTSCKSTEECRNKDGILGCYSTDPCAEVHCRVKEHCEVSDDQGVCVPDSTASCYGFGDPHYKTFDAVDYSFQGTCTYVLVNTTGLDSSLPEVTVTTKNELRGNSEGSFVRSALVEMLGHQITLPNTDRGFVLLNGIKSELPVILDDGRISITQSGIRGTLRSDIGVEVTFDWSTLIMVTLTSSYYGNVGGLCGNYNGDKEDELTTVDGSTAVNVTQWAETWSIEDYDPFCYHYCEDECPQCSDSDRTKYTGPDYCGIMSDKKGPFSGCHDKVPIAEIASDCLYDVCINDGRGQVLCEALGNYMAECQQVGVSVSSWRQLGNCSLDCPAHSHYSMCGSACPPTCGAQPEVCPKICVEGCFCDKGYVQSGQTCVIRETGCGCSHEGLYYQPGDTFWADSLCSEKCVCDAATQKVKCEQTGCRTGEKCDVVDGVQDCYPVGFKSCSAHGDPHFLSFDGRKFDFQGNCVYRLASVRAGTTGLTHFEVTLENNNRGNKRVSYAKVVTVNVYGSTYTLSVDNPGRVLVDGLETNLPFRISTSQSKVQVYKRHREAIVETNFLKVSFDFSSSVRVELATSYQSETNGLCGNFNVDPADDLMLPDGKLASNANEFGQSQWVANVEGCSRDCKDCAQPLPDDFKPPAYTSDCDVITAKDGPLADCVDRVDSKQYRDDCVYDMVLNDGQKQAACGIISDYVAQCQRNGGCVKSWRMRNFCWMRCPAKSMYSVVAPGCPASCNAPSSANCEIPPSEGCVCKPGFLLSQDRCVPLHRCGCNYNGRYIVPGQKFYPDSDCQRLCMCHGGMLACEDKPCTGNESCGVQKGVKGCYASMTPAADLSIEREPM